MQLPNLRLVRVRLAFLLLVMVTALMTLSGLYSYVKLKGQLEQRVEVTKQALQQRLQGSLQLPVWYLDTENLLQTLNSELNNEVNAIEVLDPLNRRLAKVESSDPALDLKQFQFPLNYNQAGKITPLGTVLVKWSNMVVTETLREQVFQRFVEVLVVDFCLLILLWLSLNVMIFRRLRELNASLRRLANRQSVGEGAVLTLTRHDEFDDIAKGINQITRVLSEDIAARRHAEIEARDALVQLQEAQSTLIQSEKLAALGSLVAGISHELNTPLGNALLMAGSLETLNKAFAKSVDADKLRRSDLNTFVQDSKNATELLLRSIRTAAELVRNFKQVTVDRTSAKRREFDLGTVIDEVIQTLQHLVKHKSIEVVVKISEQVSMDSFPGALGQVISNLFLNSLIHGIGERPNGRIAISCVQAASQTVTIEFSDDGVGIPDAHIDKVFDPFFTTKLGQGGSGLGLNIVHNIVTDLLGGTITVSNRSSGGAVFIIVLPLRVPTGP